MSAEANIPKEYNCCQTKIYQYRLKIHKVVNTTNFFEDIVDTIKYFHFT